MSWKGLEAALSTVDPGGAHVFATGASNEAIARLEAVLGQALPPAFRRAWSTHDGMPHSGLAMLQLLDTRKIAGEWRGLREYEGIDPAAIARAAIARGPVRPLWSSPAWIPFVVIGGETRHFCIDLDPAPGGAVGQVIWATPKEEERRVVASDVDAFLDLLARAVLDVYKALGGRQLEGPIDVSDVLRL